MYLKTGHILIVLLLLPFGLQGVMTTPIIDILMILLPIAGVPALLILIYERRNPPKIGKFAVRHKTLTLDFEQD